MQKKLKNRLKSNIELLSIKKYTNFKKFNENPSENIV
jgi:hypothetical protein